MKLNRPRRRPASTRTLLIIALVGGLVVTLWINFHWYLPDFNLLPGDRGDTRLVVFTLEHWFRVFQGLEPFFRLQIFYPDPNALAYADGLFLFGLPYAAFRLTGMDPFSSYQLLLVCLTCVGYMAWFVLLRRVLRIATGPTALGAILLTSLNALQLQADVGKLSAVHLFPALLLLLWSYIGAKDRGEWRALLGLAGFAAGFGLLFFTSYYPAWLLLFSLLILGLLAAAAGAAANGAAETLAGGRDFLKRHWRHVALALAAFLMALIPFVITYSPLIAAGSNRGFDLVLEFSPTIRDVVNVSARNVVWSPFLQALGFDFGNREVQMGTPILVLLLACMTVLALVRRWRGLGWFGLSVRDRGLLLLAGTATILVILSLKFGGASLWYAIYKGVPGASALRAVGRILMMMDLVVIILAVCGLQDVAAAWKSRRSVRGAATAALLAAGSVMLIIEQVNWTPFKLDKSDELAWVARYRAPIGNCTAFYVNSATPDGLPFGYYELDAMMISMRVGIPTVNGYSGFEPHEAFTLIPSGSEYEYRVLDWLRSRDTTQGICELNLQTGAFRSVDVDDEHLEAQRSFRMELLRDYFVLYEASTRFLREGNSLPDLYPQYLEEHGFLDPAFGYQTGPRYRWIQDRFWIGERGCGNRQCFGIAIVGMFGDLQPILERFGSEAHRILFPSPEALQAGFEPAEDTRGELMLIFSLSGQAE